MIITRAELSEANRGRPSSFTVWLYCDSICQLPSQDRPDPGGHGMQQWLEPVDGRHLPLDWRVAAGGAVGCAAKSPIDGHGQPETVRSSLSAILYIDVKSH